jgi:hypothetical protein
MGFQMQGKYSTAELYTQLTTYFLNVIFFGGEQY